ncbi:hypothetical protein JCM8208_002343 [Rhodotorula glutinis]
MAARGPIRLRVAHQKAYLWDLEDIQYLRVQHHICGSLQGTLPQVTQQNVFLGLPLVLLPEEVVLLMRNNLAVLVDDSAAHLPPTPAQAASYAASRSSAITAQREASLASEAERKALHEAKHADEIAAKRRAKDERRRAQAAREVAEKGAMAQEEEGEGRIEVSVPPLREGETTTGPPASAAAAGAPASPSPLPAPPTPASRDLSAVAYTIIIEPRSSSLAWYDPSLPRATYSTLEAASTAGVWSYPQTPLQEARCRVFEDLWRRGHYMGGGLRFGGDFLVYPGDPLRYHSHFTLTVLSTPTTAIMPLDLVAYGRLATGVKKAHLLASWDAEADEGGEGGEGRARYVSLEWAAFG